MKKIYWIMKTPGSTEEWIEMNGKQFYDFITSPAGKGRYLMDCDTYKIEVPPEQYRRWKLEANHSNYLQGFEDEVVILSLEEIGKNNGITEFETAELSVSVEDEAAKNIELLRLSEAILSLTDDERWLIDELYLRDEPKTEQEMAVSTGVSQQAIHKRKNKILKKIKLLVVKS